MRPVSLQRGKMMRHYGPDDDNDCCWYNYAHKGGPEQPNFLKTGGGMWIPFFLLMIIFVHISLVCLRSSTGNNTCSRLGNLQQGSCPREGAVVRIALVRSQSWWFSWYYFVSLIKIIIVFLICPKNTKSVFFHCLWAHFHLRKHIRLEWN